jgi:hypothetical protein
MPRRLRFGLVFSPWGQAESEKAVYLLAGWWGESNSFEVLVLSWDYKRQEMIPQGGWVKQFIFLPVVRGML